MIGIDMTLSYVQMKAFKTGQTSLLQQKQKDNKKSQPSTLKKKLNNSKLNVSLTASELAVLRK
jgi:hypothetical protein